MSISLGDIRSYCNLLTHKLWICKIFTSVLFLILLFIFSIVETVPMKSQLWCGGRALQQSLILKASSTGPPTSLPPQTMMPLRPLREDACQTLVPAKLHLLYRLSQPTTVPLLPAGCWSMAQKLEIAVA